MIVYNACRFCASTTGRLTPSGPHMRMDCTECGRYIRFVSKSHTIEPIDKPAATPTAQEAEIARLTARVDWLLNDNRRLAELLDACLSVDYSKT